MTEGKHDDRKYRAVRDLMSGAVQLVYSVNGTTDTLHVCADCTSETEAKVLLAALSPKTPGPMFPPANVTGPTGGATVMVPAA